ncbi:MurR/RpiR family transcriptional regulator [Proteinivorax hydrogeniformans]|uniref:MurR/RpiR family transcriptional regulator n=1 Tax=Proteinivorax hydrogeniformans TaxID=1826727 RepID=A0AAU8HSK1_9FIRM
MKIASVKLREFRTQASMTEKEIINFILANPKITIEMTVHQLAEQTFSSPSSIIRMCKKNGFSGYKDLCNSLIYEQALRQRSKTYEKNKITKSDSIKEIVDKVTYRNIVSLEDTRDLLDEHTLSKCISLIENSHNLYFFGIGSSSIVAKDAQQKFLRLNQNCFVSEDWHLQLLTARNMTKNDLGVVISYSGQTEEMIECAKAMQQNAVPTISITKYDASPIVGICDYNLYVAANESTFRSGAMSSRTSQLNVIDILYTGFANTRYEDSLDLIAKTHIRKGTKNG